ncbi:MAG: QueT transporter family protein [Acidaminococcaceae bacterium]|nr:QueT transporter family protein [Acidaminococcaceae bacterium]
MFNKKLSATHKLTISALTIALYVVVMVCTQSFAFGQYQIRIATAIYGLSALFPFLIVPMGLANCLSNTLMGGLGVLDIVGGTLVGIITSSVIVWGHRRGLPSFFITLAITFIPGLLVPAWLSYLLNLPYLVLMPSVVAGQIIPGIVAAIFVTAVEARLGKNKVLQLSADRTGAK